MKFRVLPPSANTRREQTWQPRVKKKLAIWNRKYLSIAGRVTLLKSTLSNLPIYFMTLFQIPVPAAKSIEKIQGQFLWGGSENNKKTIGEVG